MYIFGNLTMHTYEIRISISVWGGGGCPIHILLTLSPSSPPPPCMRIVLIKTALKNTTPVNGNTIDNASA